MKNGGKNGNNSSYFTIKEERMNTNKSIGGNGEDFAALILQTKGYEILERNYRTKLGEIDIIAKKDNVLHFVEVKTRTQKTYGYPAESVTEDKLNRIRKASQIYMFNKKIFWRNVSFDVFEIMTNMIQNCV